MVVDNMRIKVKIFLLSVAFSGINASSSELVPKKEWPINLKNALNICGIDYQTTPLKLIKRKMPDHVSAAYSPSSDAISIPFDRPTTTFHILHELGHRQGRHAEKLFVLQMVPFCSIAALAIAKKDRFFGSVPNWLFSLGIGASFIVYSKLFNHSVIHRSKENAANVYAIFKMTAEEVLNDPFYKLLNRYVYGDDLPTWRDELCNIFDTHPHDCDVIRRMRRHQTIPMTWGERFWNHCPVELQRK